MFSTDAGFYFAGNVSTLLFCLVCLFFDFVLPYKSLTPPQKRHGWVAFVVTLAIATCFEILVITKVPMSLGYAVICDGLALLAFARVTPQSEWTVIGKVATAMKYRGKLFAVCGTIALIDGLALVFH